MKLEHKKQEVAPFSRFLIRMLRYTMFAFMLIFFSVVIGIAGYHHFGKLNWLDSFYMACMILTGMGPTSEMLSESAKLFSSLYALYSGVAFLSIIALFFAPVIHRVLHILHVDSQEDQ